jgi:hypothetical protein
LPQFYKIEYYFIFDMLKKKKLAQFSKNYSSLPPEIVTKISKIWVWDPGSEIRDPEKTYSGSRIQGSKRHRTPDPGSGSATLEKTNCGQKCA